MLYVVVSQESGVAAKARLAKQNLTIPRLELLSGHMAINLLKNVAEALQGIPLINKYCWLNSSVALHWIRGQGEYKQLVECTRLNPILELNGDMLEQMRIQQTSGAEAETL